MASPGGVQQRRRKILATIARGFFLPLHERAAAAQRACQETVSQFYGASGDRLSYMIDCAVRFVERCPSDRQKAVWSLVGLFGSRLGNLLLCGTNAMSWRFPFLLTFAEMSDEAKEQALLSLSTSMFEQLRQGYKIIRTLLLLPLLGWVGPDGRNPLWAAIGYPGPRLLNQGPLQPAAQEAEKKLASALLDLRHLEAGADVAVQLRRLGLSAKACSAEEGLSLQCPGVQALVDCDVVVVGSGAGGGVAAALAAAQKLRVVVLEKGTWSPAHTMTHEDMEALGSLFEGGGLMPSEDASVGLLAGSTLGGGTRVNWCASLRTPEHVRRDWAQQGLPQFTGEGYDQAMDAVCARLGVKEEVVPDGQARVLHMGLKQLGMECNDMPQNCSHPTCHALCTMGCSSGNKQDSCITFLADAVEAGAKVLTSAFARRVVVEEGGTRGRREVARGVVVEATAAEGGEKVQLLVRARRVVVACGSLHSPALLLRSGIHCGGNVGRNLHLHPVVLCVGIFPEKEPLAPGCLAGPVRIYEGLMMGAYSKAVAHWEGSGYGTLLSVPQPTIGMYSAFMPWRGAADYRELLLAYPYVSMVIAYARDRDGGRVVVDEAGGPRVHYRVSPYDMQSLLEGQELSVRTLVAAGARSVFTLHHGTSNRHDCTGPDDPSVPGFLARLRSLPASHALPIFSAHQMGSCRMGPRPETSVVDPHGECWEVEGLFVADTSAFPTASGTNPMVTALSLSYMVVKDMVAGMVVEGGGGERVKGVGGQVLAYEE